MTGRGVATGVDGDAATARAAVDHAGAWGPDGDAATPRVAVDHGHGPGGEARPDARAVAATVTDPELPVLTLADLGVLRDVEVDADGGVVVTITPTYSGCPAMDAMRADLSLALADAGYRPVEVRTVLHPPWSTDWISAEGRRKLADAGIAPPRAVPQHRGPVLVDLGPSRVTVRCPRCGAADTTELSRFGPTPCTALRRCEACREPFEHVKAL